jgi:hypothetical protein
MGLSSFFAERLPQLRSTCILTGPSQAMWIGNLKLGDSNGGRIRRTQGYGLEKGGSHDDKKILKRKNRRFCITLCTNHPEADA